jgi:hypothetical protein
MYGDWELIPAAPIEKSSIPLLVSANTVGAPSTPLLEEERDFLSYGLAPHAIDPFRTHRSCFRPTLASDDYPVDASKVDCADILEERLNRQKTNRGIYTSEMVDAGQAIPSILDRNP